MYENDPLWRLRHALAGVGLALLISVFIAAFAGAFLGDLFGDSYGLRVAFYAGLLLYVVVGAGVLFAKVARHETRPVNPGRLALWLASLWLWPGLWWVARGRAEAEATAAENGSPPAADAPPEDADRKAPGDGA
jgi:MFS family permease